jgi:hypothetical protein
MDSPRIIKCVETSLFNSIYKGEYEKHHALIANSTAYVQKSPYLVTDCNDEKYEADIIVSVKYQHKINYDHYFLIDAARLSEEQLAIIDASKSARTLNSLPDEVSKYLAGNIPADQLEAQNWMESFLEGIGIDDDDNDEEDLGEGPDAPNKEDLDTDPEKSKSGQCEGNVADIGWDALNELQVGTSAYLDDKLDNQIAQFMWNLHSKGELLLEHFEENPDQAVSTGVDLINKIEVMDNFSSHVHGGKVAKDAYLKGLLLLEIKKAHEAIGKKGEWGKFIKAKFPNISKRTLEKYMRLAKRKDIVQLLNGGIERSLKVIKATEDSEGNILINAKTLLEKYGITVNQVKATNDLRELRFFNKQVDAAIFAHRMEENPNITATFHEVVALMDQGVKLDQALEEKLEKIPAAENAVQTLLTAVKKNAPKSDFFTKTVDRLVNNIGKILDEDQYDGVEVTAEKIDLLVAKLNELKAGRGLAESTTTA